MLGLPQDDDTLLSSIEIVGGAERLLSLLDERAPAEVIADAWKCYLDLMAAQPWRIRQRAPVLLVLVLIREAAASVGVGNQPAINRALRKHGMNWLGTWREINVRYAGQLYEQAATLPATEHDSLLRAIRLEALEAWNVVEALDGPAGPHQRRIWRGMRAVTRLWLARRDIDAQALLQGAIADFKIAQDCGDGSIQHYVLYIEALTRAYEATGEASWLDSADEVLDAATSAGHTSPELSAAHGGLLFARGLLARSEVDTSLDDLDSTEPTPTRPPIESVRAAVTAFESARSAYSLAISLSEETDELTHLWRYRRGQATARLCQVERYVGEKSPLRLSRLLHEAAADLSACEAPNFKIQGPYWPSAVRSAILYDLRAAIDFDVPEALGAIDRALTYAAREIPNETSCIERLYRLRLELELRQATNAEDTDLLLQLLEPATEDSEFPIAPLIYAGRALAAALDPGAALSEQAPWRRTDAILRPLLAVATDEGTAADKRQFAASHAVTLTYIASRQVGLTLGLARRMLEASDATLPIAPEQPDLEFQRARVTSRTARALAATGDPAEVEAAIALYSESIALLGSLSVRASTIETPLVEAATCGAEILDVEGDIAAFPDRAWLDEQGATIREQRLASLLGEAHLRRDSVAPDVADLRKAIDNFERSRALGNQSHNLLGLLGDAYGRLGRRTRNQAHLMRAIESKRAARILSAAPSRESFSVEASASISLWHLGGREEDYLAGAQSAAWASAIDPGWPWPMLQLAELVGSRNQRVPDLPESPPQEQVTGVAADPDLWRLVRARDDLALQSRAARTAIKTDEFRRSVLGGVSRTYVLDDPHKLLSTTLVLKPILSESAAVAEAERLGSFARYVTDNRLTFWAETVTPLATLSVGSGGVLATRRSDGRTLFSILLEASRHDDHGRQEAAEGQLARAVELLAHIHAWRGLPPADGGETAVDKAAQRLQRCLKQLKVPGSDDLTRKWKAAVPPGWPCVGKRDAHAANWLVTQRGKVVALDLQHDEWMPLGFELAQLIEDTPLVTRSADPAAARQRLSHRYLTTLAGALPGLQRAPDPFSKPWLEMYTPFAMHRIVFLEWRYRRSVAKASSSSERVTAEAVLRHTAAAAQWCVDRNPSLAFLGLALAEVNSDYREAM